MALTKERMEALKTAKDDMNALFAERRVLKTLTCEVRLYAERIYQFR